MRSVGVSQPSLEAMKWLVTAAIEETPQDVGCCEV